MDADGARAHSQRMQRRGTQRAAALSATLQHTASVLRSDRSCCSQRLERERDGKAGKCISSCWSEELDTAGTQLVGPLPLPSRGLGQIQASRVGQGACERWQPRDGETRRERTLGLDVAEHVRRSQRARSSLSPGLLKRIISVFSTDAVQTSRGVVAIVRANAISLQ